MSWGFSKTKLKERLSCQLNALTLTFKKVPKMKNTQNPLVSIAYATAKAQPMTLAPSATLVTKQGMKEDYHSVDGDGLIVIVSKTLLDWMEQCSIKGLCFKRFKYNLSFEHSIKHFKSGDVFQLGETELIISKRLKPCFASKQPCRMSPHACQLPHEMKFAEIKTGGIIKLGDILTLNPK